MPRLAESIESISTWILFVISASAPTWRLKLKLFATLAWPTLIENVPSLLFVTLDAPSVSPILLAALSSFVANLYATSLVIIEASVSSIPSVPWEPSAFLASVITVTESAPTVVVLPASDAIAFKLSNVRAAFVIVGVPVAVDLNDATVVNVDVFASKVAAVAALAADAT